MMQVNCVIFSLLFFTFANSEQTICCYWPCLAPPPRSAPIMTHHPDIIMENPSTDSRLEYIFYAPLLCPQGHQSINGACRRIYGRAEK